MPALIYIHGFLSSPLSLKSQQTHQWLTQHRPQVRFIAPALTPYPAKTRATLDALVAEQGEDPIYVMGSSMGGFWATYLAEQYNLPAVVINPACEPLALMPKYLHQTLGNYHNDEQYWLEEHHLQELADVPAHTIQRQANYWLMAQTGDETLDYRKAVAKYAGCKQLVEPGGDHAFQNFDAHLNDCLAFLENFYKTSV